MSWKECSWSPIATFAEEARHALFAHSPDSATCALRNSVVKRVRCLYSSIRGAPPHTEDMP